MATTLQEAPNRGLSLVQDCGYYSSSCGYCKDGHSSTSSGKCAHGMHAHRLTVYDYQELLDQGWRRSGKFLYKPDNKVTCCRQYTIRLDVSEYQPSKAHKKLLRKWEQYLAGTQQPAQPAQPAQHQGASAAAATAAHSTAEDMDQDGSPVHTASPKRARTNGTATSQQQQQQQQHGNAGAQLQDQVGTLLAAAVAQLQQASPSGCNLQQQLLPAIKVMVVPQQQHKAKHWWQSGAVFTSPCAHTLAAAVRKHARQDQQQQPVQGGQQAPSLPAASSCSSPWASAEQLACSLADTFNGLAAGQQPHVGLTAVASRGHISFMHQQQPGAQQQEATEQPAQKQQVTGQQPHTAPHQQQQQAQQPTQQPHLLEVRMVQNQFIQEEFDLWRRYQVSQHHDTLEELTRQQYKGFLVDTPLQHVPPSAAAGVPSCGYGSFHQQYWLDGKLVAVGVVDVLPRCLSSKYFFWDPDYAGLSLGRYGALREIAWVVKQHAAGAAHLRYYYLGYYIHTCPKMSYKAEYTPSELLCPQQQVWVRISDAVLQALDAAPYVVLSSLPGVQMQPNLSVPRQPPAPAEQPPGSNGAGSSGSNGGGSRGPSGSSSSASVFATPAHLSIEQQVQQQQQERQALDAQLLFVLKQPVRWGALRESGVLDDEGISLLEQRLTAWRAAVGETARTLLYATSDGMFL